MTTDLAIPESPIASALALVEPAAALVERLCRTNFVPQAYRGKPDEALACVMMGAEIGLKPMTALREIAMIQGTPALSAKLQRALVTQAGHDIWLVEASNVKCVMAGRRSDWPPDRVTHVTWTIQDAETAKLAGKDNWRNHPTDMLIARASGRVCRLVAAEVMLGLAYNVEELSDGYSEDPLDVVEVDHDAPPPPAKGRTRKLAPKAQRVESTSTAEPPEPVTRTEAADPMAEVDDLDAMAEGKAPPPVPAKRAAKKAAPKDDQEGARFTPAQALAMRCGEAGIAENERHHFYFAATEGRFRSGKDMPNDVVTALMGFLTEAIDSGEPVTVNVEADGSIEVLLADEERYFAVDPQLSLKVPDPPVAVPDLPEEAVGWDEVTWSARIKARGGTAAVIREAQRLAGELGVDPPVSKAAVVGAEGALRDALVAWLSEEVES